MRRLVPGLLILWILGTFGCGREERFRTIEGRVYARLDRVRGPLDPVVGAKISNNWDQTITATDSNGRFTIRVKRVAADEFVVLRVDWGVKLACQRLAGTSRDRDAVEIFLDGGRFGSQRCESS
jgi:hypothetical protein